MAIGKRVMHDARPFVRYVLSDEYENEQEEEKYIFPRDNQKVQLVAATSGMNAVFQWHHVRNVPDARIVAADVCAAILDNHAVTDDRRGYQAIFVPAFTVGYRLTDQRLRRLSEKEQKQELKTVLAMDFASAQIHCLKMLTTSMQEVGAQDIYDLVLIEGSR